MVGSIVICGVYAETITRPERFRRASQQPNMAVAEFLASNAQQDDASWAFTLDQPSKE